MAYEKLGRAGCIALGFLLLVVGLLMIYWISMQPPWVFTIPYSLGTMIITGIIAIFCL